MDRQDNTSEGIPEAGQARRRGFPRVSNWRSLRIRILLVVAAAMVPIIVIATTLALDEAYEAGRLPTAIAWISAAAFPTLIGVAGILAISIAMERWILRWLHYLERLAMAYARGRYSVRPRRMERAPQEFLALGEAVGEMAAAVEQRDKALRAAVDEQAVLLREVHHRVKNNLQIVGSLLSLQAARATDPKVKSALMDALIRLDALSLAQRFMQEDEERNTVSATTVFEAWAGQIRARMGPGERRLDLRIRIEERDLPIASASPLLLIATEAVMQAYRQPGLDLFACHLSLTDRPGGGVTLCLELPKDIAAFGEDRTIARDLIQGYVRQLRGRLDLGQGSRLTVEAPMAEAA